MASKNIRSWKRRLRLRSHRPASCTTAATGRPRKITCSHAARARNRARANTTPAAAIMRSWLFRNTIVIQEKMVITAPRMHIYLSGRKMREGEPSSCPQRRSALPSPTLPPQARALQSPPRKLPPPPPLPQIQKQTRFSLAREAVMQINVGGAPWTSSWPRLPYCQPIGSQTGWSPCKLPGFLFEWGRLAPPPAVEERRSEVVALCLLVAVRGVFFRTSLTQWGALRERPLWALERRK